MLAAKLAMLVMLAMFVVYRNGMRVLHGVPWPESQSGFRHCHRPLSPQLHSFNPFCSPVVLSFSFLWICNWGLFQDNGGIWQDHLFVFNIWKRKLPEPKTLAGLVPKIAAVRHSLFWSDFPTHPTANSRRINSSELSILTKQIEAEPKTRHWFIDVRRYIKENNKKDTSQKLVMLVKPVHPAKRSPIIPTESRDISHNSEQRAWTRGWCGFPPLKTLM